MREYKFRGKSYDKGWIYGNLIQRENGGIAWIREGDYYSFKVNPNTVGQYTGLRDKNGKEIYEGDIIFDSFYERKAKAVFLEGAFWLDYIDNFKEYETIHKRYQLLANYDNKSVLEVIGNIYDNPDLLEEGE